MRKRQTLIFILIALALPIIVLWWGGHFVELQQGRREQKLQRQLQAQLAFIEKRVTFLFEQTGDTLAAEMERVGEATAALQNLPLSNPDIAQITVVSKEGNVVYPQLLASLSQRELSYYLAVRNFVKSEFALARSAQQVETTELSAQQDKRYGWCDWFWEDGIVIHFYYRFSSGNIWLIRVPKLRLLAQISADISDVLTPNFAGVLRDSESRSVYTYNTRDTESLSGDDVVEKTVNLPAPLSSWSLTLSASSPATSATLIYLVCIMLILFGWIITAIAYYWLRRSLLLAAQRVSFVNQVSHELKTPLTNIRLYAELLENSEQELSENARKKLSVITSETARLSRLINNILTFSRQQRRRVQINRREIIPDDVIGSTIAKMSDTLKRRGITISLNLHVSTCCQIYPDALEQILINLLSNSDKYAPGADVCVKSVILHGRLLVYYWDTGPGIPYACREDIFKPFLRLSDAVNEGVSGSGIGLAISRELAVLHGGTLEFLPARGMTLFKLSLPVTNGGAN